MVTVVNILESATSNNPCIIYQQVYRAYAVENIVCESLD
jgi:hypothetical protein